MLTQSEFSLDDEWKFSTVRALIRGQNTLLAGDQIEEEESPNMSNVYIRQGRLETDAGYKTFFGLVRGKPRRTFRFIKNSGAVETLLVTNDTFYKQGGGEWQYVSDGVDTTLGADADSPDTQIEVVSSTGFTAADFVAIALDDGTQHRSTVASVDDATHITLDDAMSGLSTSGNVVLKALDLVGVDTEQVDILTVASDDSVVFTNGVDIVQRYNGTNVQDLTGLPSSGNVVCKALAIFANHLVLLSTIEGGTTFSKRVRWSDTGAIEIWASGNAASIDLFDTDDPIVSGRILGPYLIVYKEHSIVRGEFIGSSDLLFAFNTTVPDRGALSANSVVTVGDKQFVMDRRGIYQYTAGFSVEEIDLKIADFVFSPTDGELDPTNASKSFLIFVEGLDELWAIYPLTGNTYPTRLLRFDMRTFAFIPRLLSDKINGFGLNVTEGATRWIDLVGTWAEQTWKWNSRSVVANSPTVHLCGVDTNQVFEYDFINPTDNGVDIPIVIETKDFVNPHKEIRFDRLDVFLKGVSVVVDCSTDGGRSWVNLGTLSPGVFYTKETIHKQFVVKQFRLRFTSPSGGFGIEWFGFKHKDETPG